MEMVKKKKARKHTHTRILSLCIYKIKLQHKLPSMMRV